MKEDRQSNAILSAILSGVTGLVFVSGALAQETSPSTTEELPLRLVGDLGIGAYNTPSDVHDQIRGKHSTTLVLPYAYIDYGRLFGRIDTFGIKTFKMGYGYLEFAGRVSFEGFKTSNSSLRGLKERKKSLPFGIGTYQETPVGAFFLNAFYDVNKSHGTLLEAIYAGEIQSGSVNFYPQIGAEYRSANYVNYYYGITPSESAANRHYHSYQGKGTTIPLVALQVEIPLSPSWVVNLYGQYKWLGKGITNSPIVDKKTTQSYFISLAYRFK